MKIILEFDDFEKEKLERLQLKYPSLTIEEMVISIVRKKFIEPRARDNGSIIVSPTFESKRVAPVDLLQQSRDKRIIKAMFKNS
jgi:hypothetical protein